MIPVICIVGKSKSGKTKLMEELIKFLKKKGLRVGALKYHKHGDFEIDVEGKDTWKYARAGADAVAISSSSKFALIKKVQKEMSIDEICDRYFKDCNIVLADGFTLSNKARIIVANKDEAEAFAHGDVIAVVDKINDVEEIAYKVIEFLNVQG